MHHESCKFATGENDFSNSTRYAKTIEAAMRHQEFCESVFAPRFGLRFVQTTDCQFHTSYTAANGTRYANMGVALSHVRRQRPELCISASHPTKLTIGELVSDSPRRDEAILTGFVVCR
jgi:hypothetical protein